MQEVSTYVKMGVAFIILSSVIITVFCLWGIASAASQQYYEEQAVTLNEVSSELSDLYNAHIPVVQILKQIEASDYYANLQQIIILYAQRSNGKRMGDNAKTYTDINKCRADWDGRIGHIVHIDRTGAGTYVILVRVGG